MPLATAPAIYVAAMLGVAWTEQGLDRGALGAGWAWAAMLLLLLAVVGTVMALVRAARAGYRAFRHWRRDSGHLTKSERAAARRVASSATAWEEARVLQASLARHEVPPSISIWDVVPNPGEVFFLDVPAHYARHYGMEVPYSQTSAFYYGRPAFVLAGVGLTAMSNASRRRAAASQGVAQWREHQPCRLVVSNQRLLCRVGGRWLSFHYSAMTAVYPEVGDWTLITQYGATSPLMFSGLHVPAAAVFTVLGTHGPDAVAAHPSLQLLAAAGVSAHH
ncbi:hypothetical protein CVV67_17260 [Arthrobacter stackebrandtii]|nr:hypothetical protein CVV67_17260 [Arthrobacter stackebrandtii]